MCWCLQFVRSCTYLGVEDSVTVLENAPNCEMPAVHSGQTLDMKKHHWLYDFLEAWETADEHVGRVAEEGRRHCCHQ